VFQFVATCVRRVGWKIPDKDTGVEKDCLACTTFLSPSIAIVTRRNLQDVGTAVAIATDSALCTYKRIERQGGDRREEREEGEGRGKGGEGRGGEGRAED
jgi:hypothetical protein